MNVVIPAPASIAKTGLKVDGMPGMTPAALMPFIDRKQGQIPLLGTLAWSKQLLAWKAAWQLEANGMSHRWAIEGVNFDAAFRNGVSGAAQILSGNGDPA